MFFFFIKGGNFVGIYYNAVSNNIIKKKAVSCIVSKVKCLIIMLNDYLYLVFIKLFSEVWIFGRDCLP